MAYIQNEGEGSLFRNDKGGNEKRPDYRGDILIGGVKYRMAGWVRQGQKGSFLSIKAEPYRDEQTAQQGAAAYTQRQQAPAQAPAQSPAPARPTPAPVQTEVQQAPAQETEEEDDDLPF